MTAQLESKVELHMNSGCGTNDGIFRIQFDDGLIGCYVTPGGEVSGLTYGDRKFNMVGKCTLYNYFSVLLDLIRRAIPGASVQSSQEGVFLSRQTGAADRLLLRPSLQSEDWVLGALPQKEERAEREVNSIEAGQSAWNLEQVVILWKWAHPQH